MGVRDDLENCHFFTFPEPLKLNPKLYELISGIKAYEFEKKKFIPEILFQGKVPASRGRFQRDDELNNFFILSDVRNGHTTVHSWELRRTSDREKLICQTILKNRRKKYMALRMEIL
nr:MULTISPECIES: hypothetical protein [unclassified Coleofasciculus]